MYKIEGYLTETSNVDIHNEFIKYWIIFFQVFFTLQNPDLFYRILFSNPSARAGYDTWSIFKPSLTGLNSEFSFS